MIPDDSPSPARILAAAEPQGAAGEHDYPDLQIRPIAPSDAEQLRAAFEHWSDESRYLRFHTGMRHLSDQLLAYLTQVDGINHVALVALLPHEPPVGLGVGRFVRLPNTPKRADLALAVTDDAQGHGVARRLLIALAEAAAASGIEIFCMDVLGSNAHVRELLAGLGARCTRCEEGSLSYELPLSTLRALTATARAGATPDS